MERERGEGGGGGGEGERGGEEEGEVYNVYPFAIKGGMWMKGRKT